MRRFFICGSALSGQPDHSNLQGAKFVGPVKTAAKYRLHSVKDGWHPGIYEVDHDGISILGELYEPTEDQYQSLMVGEPPDMYEAEVTLEDGSIANAMLYPLELIQEHNYPDISRFGGWAAFKASGEKV